MTSCAVFDVVFPDQRSLGLHVLPLQLSLLDASLPTTQVYGCQVTRSSLSDEVQEGDILVSINGIALLSSTDQQLGTEADQDANQTILGTLDNKQPALALTTTIPRPTHTPTHAGKKNTAKKENNK